MEILSKRLYNTNESTLALLLFNNKPFGFIIEDEPRAVKVKGETRIPAGRYKLGIRYENTPLTLKSRQNKYYKCWFKYFIEVLDVPDFSNIYFHIGNNESHTAGCQIGAKNATVYNGEFICKNSSAMIKEFYEVVYPLLEQGKEVYYTIIDE